MTAQLFDAVMFSVAKRVAERHLAGDVAGAAAEAEQHLSAMSAQEAFWFLSAIREIIEKG